MLKNYKTCDIILKLKFRALKASESRAKGEKHNDQKRNSTTNSENSGNAE